MDKNKSSTRVELLRTASDLERNTHQIRLNGGVIPDGHLIGWVWGLGAHLLVSVPKELPTVSMPACQPDQKIHVLHLSTTTGVEAGPLAVSVLREELGRVGDGGRVASRGSPLESVFIPAAEA